MAGWPAANVPVREFFVAAHGGRLEVELATPDETRGLVLLVSGNCLTVGSQPISTLFHRAGIATATCQLLTWVEREHPIMRQGVAGNVAALTERLIAVLDGVRNQREVFGAPIGLLGGGLLAAAAMEAATRRPLDVDALVCRNGPLDQVAGIEYVQAATLLVTGTGTADLLRQNENAFARLQCTRRLEVIRERDLTDWAGRAAVLSREWFTEHLCAVAA